MVLMGRPEPLATPPEVARYLRIDEKTLANWRSLGIGPDWIKVGGREVRYDWADVKAWCKDKKTGEPDEAEGHARARGSLRTA